MKNVCSKSNFPAGIYRFKVKLANPCFDDVCVNSIFYSMTLTLISTCARFPKKILLHRLKNIYLLLIFSLNFVCVELREGFYYFTLITNLCSFFLTTHSTLLHYFTLHGIVSYCYYTAYDPKACSIFDRIYCIVIIEYLSVLHFY